MVPYTAIGSFLDTLKKIYFLDPPRGSEVLGDPEVGVGARQKNHINTRILQTVFSRIPLIIGALVPQQQEKL